MRRVAGCIFRLGFLVTLAVPASAIEQSSTPAPAPAVDAKPVIDADGTYHIGNGVTPPKLVYSVDAEFSDAARHRKISGTTVLALNVLADGTVTDIHVKQSAANAFVKEKDRKAAASLDQKAIDAVRQYRFEPAMYQGKPVPVATTIDVNFHIY